MKRPDIAVYIPSLRGGGAERVALTLAREFAARGMVTHLVLVRAAGAFLAEVPQDVRIVDLDRSRAISSLPALLRYLRAERPKAILATPDHVNVVALLAALLSRVPMRKVVRVANTVSVSVRNSRNLRNRFVPPLMGWLYRKADAVIAVSEGVAEDLVRTTGLPRSLVRTIYNPIVTPDIVEKSREQLSHPWFAPGEPPVILGVGRLVPQKDFLSLLRAFLILRSSQRARLLILGEGPERDALQAFARELKVDADVEFAGFVSNPFAYMSRAALYVLSSAWEGLPATLIQSMACGTPVVSTDCPSGPAEILENGRWGRLTPVGEPAALASAMHETLAESKHPDVRQRAREFSVDQAAVAYLSALKTPV